MDQKAGAQISQRAFIQLLAGGRQAFEGILRAYQLLEWLHRKFHI